MTNILYNPKYWGKRYWAFLHIAAMTYKPKQKKMWRHFITKFIPMIIPCGVCARHFRLFIKSRPRIGEYGITRKAKHNHVYFALKSERNMKLFFYYAHKNANKHANQVNKNSASSMTLEKFRKKYDV